MKLGPILAKSSKRNLWNLNMFSLVKRSPPLEEQRQYIKGALIALEREVQKNELFWKDFPLKVSTADQIRERLLT